MIRAISFVFAALFLTFSQFVHAQDKAYRMPSDVQRLFPLANVVIEGRPAADSSFIKGESAAIEYNVDLESYGYSGGRWKIAKHSRFAVRILDQSGLEEFSTIDAPENSRRGSGYMGAVIKTNLTLRIIKGKDNSVVTIPTYELSQNSNDEVAVPGLEIGDRLEIIADTWINIKSQYMFCTGLETESFRFDYPVLFGYRRMEIHKSLNARIKMSEHAPRFNLKPELSDKNNTVYELEYANFEKKTNEMWAKIYEDAWKMTYEVCLNRYYKPRDQIFTPGKLDTITGEQRAKDLVWSTYFNGIYRMNYYHVTDEFVKWFNENHSEYPGHKAFMEAAHTWYRSNDLVYDLMTKRYTRNYHNRYMTDDYFLKLFAATARKKNIEFEHVFTVSKYWGEIDKSLFTEDISPVFRYKDEEGEWHYIYPVRTYFTSGSTKYYLEGQEAIATNDGETFVRLTLPKSTHLMNSDLSVYTIDLDLEAKKGHFTHVNSFTGLPKTIMASAVLNEYDYISDIDSNLLRYGAKSLSLTKRDDRRKEKKVGRTELNPEERFKELKSLREEDFDIDKYLSYEVLKSGVAAPEDTMQFKEEFEINNILEQLGPNYVLKFDKITSGQGRLSDLTSKERVNDIVLRYPVTLGYEYVLKAPEGYTFAGYENLAKDVENDFGYCKITVLPQGNDLVISHKRAYKQAKASKEDWSHYKEILEASLNFNTAQVLIKPLK